MLQIKDNAHAEKPVQLARHAQGTYTRNAYYSPDSAVKGWRIPKSPDSWKMAFSSKLFQMLLNWRTAAYKKASQEQLRKHLKSRFPAFNIPRRSEEVATDTIFSDTPAIDSGVTMAQIFVGKRTLVTDVYPLKSQKQFVNTLEDNIRFRGAMTKLISDYAKVEISNKVKDILRMYHSSSWNSSPTTKPRIQLRGDTAPSKVGPTPS